MEKKGTKIAYFVALAVVVVALVIAKVTNDGSGFVATGWALFPPVVAIALALISKEVYSSLFLGCVAAALLLANFQPWQMVVNFIGAGEGVGMINAIDISILIFLVILGIMVDLMNKAGGSAAFGRWAKKAVKTRSGAQLLTMLLGVLIFIDDYFNCLTVGAVMRPVTESHKISRAKLAYVIDATAAPVCMLAPVSSWAAAVASYVPDGFPGSRISMFLSQIPFNYYCILTLVMVIVTSVLNIDYGPMLTHEYNAQVKDDLFTTPERPFAGADDYEEGEEALLRAGSAGSRDRSDRPVHRWSDLDRWYVGRRERELSQLHHVLLRRQRRYRPVLGLHHRHCVHLRVLLVPWPDRLQQVHGSHSQRLHPDDLPHPDPLLRLDPVRPVP